MRSVIISRLVQFPLILALIYFLTFAMVWLAPGDPFIGEGRYNKEAIAQLKTQFHATTWYGFLAYYPYNVLTSGDFGPSLKNREFSVTEMISGRLPVSVELGIVALIIAVGVGIPIGTLAAVRRDGVLDWSSVAITLTGVSLPSFVVAAGLLSIFVTYLEWFNVGKWDSPADVVLPAIALSLGPMAYIVRLTRVSMLDVLGADYVRTARAKGLSRSRVIWKHCLRNALLPVLSYLGPAAAYTLTGSFVVEKVFNVPGLGEKFVDSVLNRDATMILGLVMVYSTLLLAMNLIVDIGYAFFDPRIDLSAKAAT